MNDPNGLIYYKGKYHLFFQHNPSANHWGNMSWGHAMSEDLVTWEELKVAILSDEKHAIFSGSVVVDHTNSSGFGTLDKPAMVAIYTAHKHDNSHQAQALAYSLDEGINWVKYENNPVLDLNLDHFRDPKVFWDDATRTWLMAVVLPKQRKVNFYRSQDLKYWQYLSKFGPAGAIGGDWECPDFFSIAVNGDNKKTKWILIISINPGGLTGGSGTQYFIGDWNGTDFVADDLKTRWLDFGRDNYAGVTFNNAPNQRRIFIGWMNNWSYAKEIPTSPWRGAMTLPRELTLETRGEDLYLCARPILELSNYLHESVLQKSSVVPMEITASVSIEEGISTTIRVSANAERFVEFGYDAATNSVFVDRSNAWCEIPSENLQRTVIGGSERELDIRAIIDYSSIEVFAGDGAYVLTNLVFLPETERQVNIASATGLQPPLWIKVRKLPAGRQPLGQANT